MTELLDRNKTALTHSLTGTAMGYLHGSGFKPIETEVPVANGWIADLASFITPTYTEMKKLTINYRFLGENITAFENESGRYNKTMYRYGHILTAIVEVKAFKSDLEKDLKTKFRAGNNPAHFLFLAYPCGVITDEEVPMGWIGLKCSQDGKKLIKRVVSEKSWLFDAGLSMVHSQNVGDIADFIAQVAIRRHHRTEYAEMRHMLKSWRAESGENIKLARTASTIKLIADWIRGDKVYCTSLVSALGKLPDHIKKDLEYLEGLRNNDAPNV